MTRGRFLTARWNNLLSLGVGLPALAYAMVALSAPALSGLGGFIGMVIVGVVY
jgi:hypothetical protein